VEPGVQSIAVRGLICAPPGRHSQPHPLFTDRSRFLPFHCKSQWHDIKMQLTYHNFIDQPQNDHRLTSQPYINPNPSPRNKRYQDPDPPSKDPLLQSTSIHIHTYILQPHISQPRLRPIHQNAMHKNPHKEHPPSPKTTANPKPSHDPRREPSSQSQPNH
jgi:hypothetical protein